MLNAAFTQREILDQLDGCAKVFTFPMLDNGYVYPANVRLSAYRDLTRWALVIEVVGVNNRGWDYERFETCLYCFGNCLRQQPGLANENFLFPITEGIDGSIFDADDDWFIREDAQTLRISERIVQIPRDEAMFAAKGIEHERPGTISIVELLRSLVPEYRADLLATEAELRQRVPQNLPLSLRLDTWHHPQIGSELPSQSETFSLIAAVLAEGDAALYAPSNPPNTHWRHWPLAGSC